MSPAYFPTSLNVSFKVSKHKKMIAELGALLKHVIPHPLYKAVMPWALYMPFPTSQNPFTGSPRTPIASVCIFDLIESAGKKRKL